MAKDKKDKQINGTTILVEELNTVYPYKRLIVLLIIMVLLLVVAVFSVIYKEYASFIGIIIFEVYVAMITFWQKSSDYVFTFVPNAGIKDFTLSYKGKLLSLDYRLDKNGRFMWADAKKPIKCISYADGSKMNKYITKYRVLNYINVVMEQNGLYSDHAW